MSAKWLGASGKANSYRLAYFPGNLLYSQLSSWDKEAGVPGVARHRAKLSSSDQFYELIIFYGLP